MACRVLFPWPGTEPTALNVLTTRPPGNSLLIFNIASLWGLNWVAFYCIHSHRDNEMQWQWWGLPPLMGEPGSVVVRRAIQSSWPLDSPPTLAPALGLQPPPLPLMLLLQPLPIIPAWSRPCWADTSYKAHFKTLLPRKSSLSLFLWNFSYLNLHDICRLKSNTKTWFTISSPCPQTVDPEVLTRVYHPLCFSHKTFWTVSCFLNSLVLQGRKLNFYLKDPCLKPTSTLTRW